MVTCVTYAMTLFLIVFVEPFFASAVTLGFSGLLV